MFRLAAACLIAPEIKVVTEDGKDKLQRHPKLAHKFAFAADVIAGIGLLIIGIYGNQWGLLQTTAQFALIGAGATYIGLVLLPFLIGNIKEKIAPDSYLFR